MKSSAKRSSSDAIGDAEGETFAKRLVDALDGRGLAGIARQVGIAPSTLQRYLNGSMPAADIGFRLARALSVRPEWLFEAAGPKYETGEVVGIGSGQVTVLPVLDLFAFGEQGKPAATDQLALPTAWLMAAARSTTGLWLAEMPNDALPSLAKEGELLVCKDPEATLQDRRIYIFLLDGRPIVRRVFVRPEGLQLRGESDADTIEIAPQELEHLRPAGRVLSAIALHSA